MSEEKNVYRLWASSPVTTEMIERVDIDPDDTRDGQTCTYHDTYGDAIRAAIQLERNEILRLRGQLIAAEKRKRELESVLEGEMT